MKTSIFVVSVGVSFVAKVTVNDGLKYLCPKWGYIKSCQRPVCLDHFLSIFTHYYNNKESNKSYCRITLLI